MKKTIGKKNRTTRILIIEDNLAHAQNLKKKILSESEFQVDIFTDPYSVLQNFKAGFYDIILVDHILAKTSNKKVYQKIMQVDEKVKICYLSDIHQNYKEVRKMFPESERECFIPRPIKAEVLLKNIIRCCLENPQKIL